MEPITITLSDLWLFLLGGAGIMWDLLPQKHINGKIKNTDH